jgi:hypothetical protein
MLTVYVSAEAGVARTAKALVRGAGEAAGEAIGDAEAVGSGEAAGEAFAFAEGDVAVCDPGPPQAAISTAAASQDVNCFIGGIMNCNADVRTGLRFRYDPAPEAGPDPHPQSNARTGTHGRLLLSVLFFVVGGILRTLNLAEVTSHLV